MPTQKIISNQCTIHPKTQNEFICLEKDCHNDQPMCYKCLNELHKGCKSDKIFKNPTNNFQIYKNSILDSKLFLNQ